MPSPPPSSRRGQFSSLVKTNDQICREHYRLILTLDQFPPTEPGEFVQISCRDLSRSASEVEFEWREDGVFDKSARELFEPQAYLRRPFSLAGRRDTAHEVELEFIHRVVGVGTQWLSLLRPADTVQLLGPLGNRFALPHPHETALLVGGGVGIPPMLYLAEKLAGRRAIAFCGALSRDLLPLTIEAEAPPPGSRSIEPLTTIAEFSRHDIPAIISTDDGSYGFQGYITQALEAFLESWDEPAVIYTCGPEPMMKRVARIAVDRAIECQVAVERAMACGMGTCQSCCIRVKKPDPCVAPLPGSDWCWRLACTDGPIFRAADLLW